jgi:hypothetical protein
MEGARQTWTDERLDDLSRRVDDGFRRIDARFDHLETRFDHLETRFDGLQRMTVQVVGGGMTVAVFAALLSLVLQA